MLLSSNPRGPKVSFVVRYQGGRKDFERLEGTDPALCARAFAEEQRKAPKGWAEIARVTTEIVERKR